MTAIPRPHPNCYWAQPDRLLAGEYPGDQQESIARTKLRRLLDAGVTFFLDLTHPTDRLTPYAPLLEEIARAYPQSIGYRQMAILDLNVPTVAEMGQILDCIDAELNAGQRIYLHCWGGVGRTGTVIGCHFVRHAAHLSTSGEDALAQLARLWQDVAKRDRHPRSPETAAQIEMVRTWAVNGC